MEGLILLALGVGVAVAAAKKKAAAQTPTPPQRQTVSPTARPGMRTRSAIGWDDSGIGAQHTKTGPQLPDNVPGKKRLLENEITKLDSVIAESVDPGHAFQFKTARERTLRQLSRINQVPFAPAKDLG